MKTLEFTEKKQYEFIYEAVVGKQDGYNIQLARTGAKVLDKLEAVGKIKESTRTGVTLYEAKTLPAKVEFEDTEFDLIKQSFMSITWMGPSVRDAVKIADWLEQVK